MDHIKTVPDHWTFKDTSVVEGFDQHVREQLPWYELVTNAVVQIGRHYIGEGGLVYDIGASTGNVGRALDETLQARSARLIAVEESQEMADRWYGPGELVVAGVQEIELEPYDFGVAMLCLMFLRPDELGPLLDRLVAKLRPGGALVLVERMLPPDGYLSIVSSRLTLEAKRLAGATGDEIVTKELSLAGAQRPLDRRLLARYNAVEWFRYGDFAGWVIEAPWRLVPPTPAPLFTRDSGAYLVEPPAPAWHTPASV